MDSRFSLSKHCVVTQHCVTILKPANALHHLKEGHESTINTCKCLPASGYLTVFFSFWNSFFFRVFCLCVAATTAIPGHFKAERNSSASAGNTTLALSKPGQNSARSEVRNTLWFSLLYFLPLSRKSFAEKTHLFSTFSYRKYQLINIVKILKPWSNLSNEIVFKTWRAALQAHT